MRLAYCKDETRVGSGTFLGLRRNRYKKEEAALALIVVNISSGVNVEKADRQPLAQLSGAREQRIRDGAVEMLRSEP